MRWRTLLLGRPGRELPPGVGQAGLTGRPGRRGWARRYLSGAIFIAGWILSPLTFYNDAFVNIPLSLLIAWPFAHFWHWDFAACASVAYVFTNLLGLALMAVGVRLSRIKGTWRVSAVRLLIAGAIYTLAVFLIATLIRHLS